MSLKASYIRWPLFQGPNDKNLPSVEIQTTEIDTFGSLPEGGNGGHWGKEGDKW